MKIKHLPNSITPFENCGYNRIPLKPIEGEEITLNCLVEENKEKTPILKLRLNHNGIESDALIAGHYEKTDEKGEYYSFSIGAYHTGDYLKYQFLCQEQDVTSDWYEFEIYQQAIHFKPKQIYYRDNSIMLQFAESEAEHFNIILLLEENQIQVQMLDTDTSLEDMEVLENNKIWDKKQYTIKLEKKPCSLLICDKQGNELIHYQESEHLLYLFIDRKHSVRNLKLQSNLKAKGIYGLGEKYNRVNQLGLEAKIYVYEHFTHQQEKTYLPIPFFFTDAGYGLFFDTNYQVNVLTEQKDATVLLTLEAVTDSRKGMDPFYLYFGEPQTMLKQYIDASGECMLPPKWSFGPWMSANGWNTQKETLEQIDKMKEYQIPASVLVLEAWSDETTFYLYNNTKYEPKGGAERLTYEDFSFDENGLWPNPKEMSRILHENNVKLILWQIPVIKYMDTKDNTQHVNDEEYAIRKGYCVKDKDGNPYRITDKWFAGSLVPDFTNQEAKDWWFSKRRFLIEDLDIDGFKTDGGEFIYDNQAVFSNGKTGEEMRNPYPNLYLEGYHEFMNQYKGEGKGILFSRAGYTGAQRYPIHWAGDQMSEYVEFRSQIKAGLSAGLSGVIFWGFDIAGFAGDLPTTDLFLRSTAMAAFSPVMQFHAEPRTGQFFLEERRSWNNDRSPWNMAEVNKEPVILEIYRNYANIRMNLMPYIYNEAIYCSEQGRPMFAHLILDYPEDEKVIDIEDEYLFGRSMLVAPVIYEGATNRNIYLPKGNWYNFFSDEKYEGGREFLYECPLGEIPVFVKEGYAIALNLSERLQLADYVGNDLSSYQNFSVKTFGECGSLEFKDDMENHFTLEWKGSNRTVIGTYPKNISFIHNK